MVDPPRPILLGDDEIFRFDFLPHAKLPLGGVSDDWGPKLRI
jgi:hypothetical protein